MVVVVLVRPTSSIISGLLVELGYFPVKIFKGVFGIKFLENLKASYGTTGNDQIGNYQYLSLYNNVLTPVTYQGSIGLGPTKLPNPYLAWEETKSYRADLS